MLTPFCADCGILASAPHPVEPGFLLRSAESRFWRAQTESVYDAATGVLLCIQQYKTSDTIVSSLLPQNFRHHHLITPRTVPSFPAFPQAWLVLCM